MPEVRIEGISRHFGSVAAVDNIGFTVAEGSFVTLLGPSGCGKTTTLRMIAGLEQNDRGRITIGDRVVSDAETKFFVPPERRNAGMVFQSYAIWPHMTVFENIAYPLRIRRYRTADLRERVKSALRLVEMEALIDRQATALSGGQQQRVAIARAVVFEPSVLLLDEPLSNLDAKLREQMRIELRTLQQRLGVTTIYVTHDQEEAMALSDRIIIMREGHILQNDEPEAVYFRPRSLAVAAFCGSPNILGGRVHEVRQAGDGLHVHIRGDGWEGWSRAADGLAPGAEASIVARPEAISILPRDETPDQGSGSDAPGGVVWRGEVETNVFRGFRRTLVVRAAGGEGRDPIKLTVDAAADRQFSIGEAVALHLPRERSWACAA